jgi:hypothetical protein
MENRIMVTLEKRDLAGNLRCEAMSGDRTKARTKLGWRHRVNVED